MTFGGWLRVRGDDGAIHVVPIADLRTHDECDCWCCPESDCEPGAERVVTHNALDRREAYETGELKPH